MKGSTPPSMAAGLKFDFEKQWSELPLPTKLIALLAEKITYNILVNKLVTLLVWDSIFVIFADSKCFKR